jgi:hypothetical protein
MSESKIYFRGYIEQSPSSDVAVSLEVTEEMAVGVMSALTEDQWKMAYAPGKWTLAELFLHMIDTERIMAYRALRFSRGDQSALPGFDENAYVPMSDASNRSGESLLDEFIAVRQSTYLLFSNMSEEQMTRTGSFSGYDPLSVYEIGLIIAGHVVHHLGVVEERYLVG